MAGITLDLSDSSLNRNLINGEWVGCSSGRTFQVFNPATQDVVGSPFPESDVSDLEKALTAASNALPQWRSRSGRERARILRRWYDLLIEHKEDLATIISAENGKAQPDAAGEVMMAAGFLEWFAEEAVRIYGDVAPHSNPTHRIMILKEPIGVCGMITPWNFPLAMLARKVAPCLAAGCTAIVKPDGLTPYSASAFALLGLIAGVPAGVVNVIHALEATPSIGRAMCEAPEMRKLSFTGSTRVGKILLSQSANNVQKLSLELGGNAPFIVLDDSNLNVAVTSLIACKFKVAGQTCVCANRIYVQDGIFDKFVEKVVEAVNDFQLGPASHPKTTIGPLIHGAAVAKCVSHVEDAVSKGAKILTGGERSADKGENFFKPTVLINCNATMLVAQEETFGPVAGIFKFSIDSEAIAAANNTNVGLASYLMSTNAERIRYFTERIEAGMLAINTGIIADPAAPFGGIKSSGFGREASKYGIEEYMTLKTVVSGNCGALL